VAGVERVESSLLVRARERLGAMAPESREAREQGQPTKRAEVALAAATAGALSAEEERWARAAEQAREAEAAAAGAVANVRLLEADRSSA